jgi:hypothetical protein
MAEDDRFTPIRYKASHTKPWIATDSLNNHCSSVSPLLVSIGRAESSKAEKMLLLRIDLLRVRKCSLYTKVDLLKSY